MWCFVCLDASLGKLPRILPYTTRPKQLPLAIGNNDANIGAKAVSVDHGHHLINFQLPPFFHKGDKRINTISRLRCAYKHDDSAIIRRFVDRTEVHLVTAARLTKGSTVSLAIFDLDNTLISIDSDHAWGEFLLEQGVVDPIAYREANERFMADYNAGTLDMAAFLEMALEATG